MEFHDLLNHYIDDILNCSSKDLARTSNLSPAAISRYRNGNRVPDFESEQFRNIVTRNCKISARKENKKHISRKNF